MTFNGWLSIYLAGCVLTLLLTLLKVVLYSLVTWLEKTNVLLNNLKKIQPPDGRNLFERAGVTLKALTLEVALSWINVPVIIWQLLSTTVKAIREVFASVPEKIKELRFPLKNNPDLDAESVWAHFLSLRVVVGELVPTGDGLASEINEIRSYRSSFNFKSALNQLKQIGVIDADLVTEATKQLTAEVDSDPDE